jgi:DNA/RNA-binding protein KIN17
VLANRVYQEFIGDKSHMHMNSTRWVTLTEFAKHLGRTGVARVDENEKGWFIAWIDNSPKALAKQEASLAKERLTVSDEQRERTMIAEQIERAKADAGEQPEAGPSTPPAEAGLKREDGTEKVVLSFSMKPAAAASAAVTSAPASVSGPSAAPVPAPTTSMSFGSSSGLKLNPLKPTANPLKRPNVFKAASAASAEKEAPSKKRELSAAEKLMAEDQELKRRRMDRAEVAT